MIITERCLVSHFAVRVYKYLFIAVTQHIPHTMNKERKLWPLLVLLIPALFHDLKTTTQKEAIT